jgi:GH24 family phage-related lysozyme (muramidase)
MARIPGPEQLGTIQPSRSQIFVPGPRDPVPQAIRGVGRALGQTAQAVGEAERDELQELQRRQGYQASTEFYNFENRMRERLAEEIQAATPGELGFGKKFLDIYDAEFTSLLPTVTPRNQPRVKAAAAKLRGDLHASANRQQGQINTQFYKNDLEDQLNRAGLIVEKDQTEITLNQQYTQFVDKVKQSGLTEIEKQEIIRGAGPALSASLVDALAQAGDFDNARRVQAQFEAAAIKGGSMSPTAANIIKGFEGFRVKPYWDVNAYRIGYGSDTITRADGTQEKVRIGASVSVEDAERDLHRRIGEFQNTIVKQIGVDAWSALPDNAQAALTSVAYNYGSLPGNVAQAARSGDIETIAASVEARASDNDGINAKRRAEEAAIIRGDGTVRSFSIGPDWSNDRDRKRIAAENARLAAARKLESDLLNDPIGRFNQQGTTTELSLDDPASFQNRAVDFGELRDTYGPQGFALDSPLSKKEAAAIVQVLQEGSREEQLTVLGNLTQLGEYTDLALKQIKQDNGDYGYVADMYASTQPGAQQFAGDVLRGYQSLQDNPDQSKLILQGGVAGDVKTADTFAALVGGALYNVTGPTAQAAKNAADALYLSRQLAAGAEDFDEAAYEQAVSDILGGALHDHNGMDIVLPYGVDETQFEQFLSGIDDIDLEALSLSGVEPVFANGEPVQPEWFEDEARFVTLGQGTYGFIDVMGSKVADANGDPYIMSLDAASVNQVIERSVQVRQETEGRETQERQQIIERRQRETGDILRGRPMELEQEIIEQRAAPQAMGQSDLGERFGGGRQQGQDTEQVDIPGSIERARSMEADEQAKLRERLPTMSEAEIQQYIQSHDIATYPRDLLELMKSTYEERLQEKRSREIQEAWREHNKSVKQP